MKPKHSSHPFHGTLTRGVEEGRESASAFADFASGMVETVSKLLHPKDRGPREVGKYWPTDLGKTCDRELWYQWHEPDRIEPLSPSALFKFKYGDLIEELLMLLAWGEGHKVTNKQGRVEAQFKTGGDIVTVSGRIDALIDGRMVDAKSASSFAYQRYIKEGVNRATDTFGYLWQLAFYYRFAKFDDFDSEKEAAFLFADKTLGHCQLVEVPHTELPTKQEILEKVRRVHTLATMDELPKRTIDPVPDGKSGNMKLPTKCSYCKFKFACHPKVRTFVYSNGPRYLTDVTVVPKVPEVANAA